MDQAPHVRFRRDWQFQVFPNQNYQFQVSYYVYLIRRVINFYVRSTEYPTMDSIYLIKSDGFVGQNDSPHTAG